MKPFPPLSVRITPDRWAGAAELALVTAALLAAALWLSDCLRWEGGHLPKTGLAGAMTVLCAAQAGRSVLQHRRRSRGALRLAWTGQAWTVSGQGVAHAEVRVQPVIDLGRWMLLRVRPASAGGGRVPIWITAAPHCVDVPWHAWRCTLYCARPSSGRHQPTHLPPGHPST